MIPRADKSLLTNSSLHLLCRSSDPRYPKYIILMNTTSGKTCGISNNLEGNTCHFLTETPKSFSITFIN